MRKRLIWILVFLMTGAAEAKGTLPKGSLVFPCYLTTTPIKVDATLNEPCWAQRLRASGFTDAHTPEKLSEPQTVFQAFYDENNLYLGVRCLEPLMEGIMANVKVQDGEVWHDDCIEIFIDTNHNHRTYFQFVANSLGVRFDRSDADMSWTAPWEVVASRGEKEWSLEIAIPFHSLGTATPKLGEVWGFNLCRERYATGRQELSNWSHTGGNFHTPRNFGHLIFVGTLGESALEEFLKRLLKEHPSLVVCLSDGFLTLEAKKVPKRISYRQMAQAGFKSPDRDLKELGALVQKPAASSFVSKLKELEAIVESVGDLLAKKPILSAEEWVWTLLTSQEVSNKLESLKWEIKLHLLLSE